jgi:protein MpaA
MTSRSRWLAFLVASQLVFACSSDSGKTTPSSSTGGTASTSIVEPSTTSSTIAVPSTSTPTTNEPATTTSTTTTTSTSTTTTVAPSLVTETRVIGQSVQGRDITAYRMGTPGGRPVLLIGVIHGDEAKGFGITQLIRTMPTPSGIDLWIIDSINPDGQAANTRQNANGVDLNRNVSYKWNYIPQSADNGQYSGEAPADQPETKALESLVAEIKPQITIFWHQDANRVSPGGARPEIPLKFASIVGLSTASTPCTAGCTGTATQYVNHTVKGGTAFIVELPGDDAVTPEMVAIHAAATLQVIAL